MSPTAMDQAPGLSTGPTAAPSRFDNPFSTCWTRPGALPWLAAAGLTAAALVERLDAERAGQLVGPHGVGKSTLLAGAAAMLERRGATVLRWTLSGGGASSPMPDVGRGDVLLIDGYEKLPLAGRLVLATRWCGRLQDRDARLLVTCHRPARLTMLRLPVLAMLEPDWETVRSLFDQLVANRPTPVTIADCLDSYRRHDGNAREVWFDLYDRHECLSAG